MITVQVNGKQVQLEAPTPLPTYLAQLGVNPKAVAVEHNGTIIERAAYEDVTLKQGDTVEIVRMVGGGKRKEIPPFRLVPEPMTDAAAALPGFQWAGPEIGTRHQLGGEPTWIQQPEHAECDTCHEQMTFYGQLDSINDDFVIGDAGIVYLFVCFDCVKTKAILQCY